MSIINQMLQDLEQRHVDGAATGMSGQVRAAPDERKIHAAWMLVVILTVLLIGLLLWIWLRPTPVAKQQSGGAPQLALKIAPDLNVLPQSVPMVVAPVAIPASQVMATAPDTPPAAAPHDAVTDKSVGNEATKKLSAGSEYVAKPASTLAPISRQIATRKQKREARDVKSTPSASNDASSSADNAGVPAAPVMLNKQIEALTPQQRAENDYRKATGLAQQGHTPEAIALLEQVLQTDAQNTGARQTLIALLIKSKRQDDAIRCAQDGVALDPKQTGFAMIVARLQLENGQQQLAIETLQHTLPYAQERSDYRAFLAALLQREGRHKEAIEQYLLALRKAPQNGVWWMGLGISMQADNRPAEAREAFSRAKQTNTLSPELQAFVEQKLK